MIAKQFVTLVTEQVYVTEPKQHWSDCAMHNEPAYPNKECDCGGFMNNEPVAWINKTGSHGYLEWDKDDEAEINTPLYTHPVKELTLTDEEITDCMGSLPKYNSEIVDEDLVKFSRAILRKAQEK